MAIYKAGLFLFDIKQVKIKMLQNSESFSMAALFSLVGRGIFPVEVIKINI